MAAMACASSAREPSANGACGAAHAPPAGGLIATGAAAQLCLAHGCGPLCPRLRVLRSRPRVAAASLTPRSLAFPLLHPCLTFAPCNHQMW